MVLYLPEEVNGDGQHQGVEQGSERLEDRDVLDKRAVPEKTEHERADEHEQDEYDEGFDHLLKVATFGDVGEHL